MAQGEFTKQEADEIRIAVNEMFEGIPKSKRLAYLCHLNDILLFIGAARRVAPNEPAPTVAQAMAAANVPTLFESEEAERDNQP